jgi:hypothetical protein
MKFIYKLIDAITTLILMGVRYISAVFVFLLMFTWIFSGFGFLLFIGFLGDQMWYGVGFVGLIWIVMLIGKIRELMGYQVIPNWLNPIWEGTWDFVWWTSDFDKKL